MKRNLLATIMLASLATSAIAGNFYVGPTIYYQHNSASHSSFNGLHPNLSFGYGAMLSGNYYLAGEVFAAPFTAKLSSSTNIGAENAKTTHSFGLSILPGMKLNDNLTGYIRLGLINSRFSGPSTSKTGGQAGLGFLTPINSNWDFRAEYVYTTYQSISGLGSVKSNALGLGFSYNFDSASTQPYKTL